jgi:hypothetical protein
MQVPATSGLATGPRSGVYSSRLTSGVIGGRTDRQQRARCATRTHGQAGTVRGALV